MAIARKLGLPVVLLCACMAAPASAAILPTDLDAKVGPNYQPTDEDEREIWKTLQQLEDTIRKSPQRLAAPELEAYTRRVFERLIGRPAPDLRIYLMRDASFNAAMFPTGMMIVHTGLMARVRNEAEFAAVLGHEAGHYLRKHYLDRDRKTRERANAIEVVTAAGRSSYYGFFNPYSPMVNHAIVSVFRFNRNQESEADAYGIMLMARAGYPPRAASAIWEELIEERRASATARDRRYREEEASATSTHPPTARRIADLAETADHLVAKAAPDGSEAGAGWPAATRPYRAMLLNEQVSLNDPGASLYLLETLAKARWTGLLRFNEGEVYRLRRADGDSRRPRPRTPPPSR